MTNASTRKVAPRKSKKKIKRRLTNRDAKERLRDLPEWLEEFTDNPEDTETPVPAHVSQDSGSVCMRTKITKALAEDALAKQNLEQKSSVT